MKKSRYPIGWDEERVRRVLAHYEEQTEEEAVAEAEAAFELNLKRDDFDSMRKDRQDNYRELERLRQEFVETFPISRIKNMDKDEYVQGQIINGEPNKDTFCYWIEWKTRELGGIQGANAIKFKLYVDKESQQYKFTKEFENEDEAIDSIRKRIAKLIELGEKKDLESIKEVSLSPMFKGKILFLYFPDDFVNVFSKSHIDYFLKQVGIHLENEDLHLIDKKEVLLRWKNTDPVMEKWNMFEFSSFLYTELGKPGKKALNELIGTLTHEEAEESQKFIDLEFGQTEVRMLGRYIIADPAVCHGEPTFRGTRILVADILEQVASGVAWEGIVEEWRGTLTTEAIAEAVRLAREALTVYIAN